MRTSRTLALGAALLVVIAACTPGGGSKPTIRIGSDGFYESALMAEIYAQVLEANGYPVERKLKLGSRKVRQPALEAGEIDLAPEYLGSGLGFYDASKISGDPAANKQALQEILNGKGGGITVLGFTPGEDTNAFVVRSDTAAKYGLAKMSDLAAVQDELRWGLPPECETNPLCRGALETAYGIRWPPKQLELLAACDAPIAEALNNGAVDVAELCSTQPAIAQFGFVVLDDDKQTQPAENIAPLVRNDYLSKLSDRAAFEKLLDDVSAKITTEVLTELGVKVAVEQQSEAAVAKEWLTANGLLK
ncbi:MAG: glycine/betaine ABC transporter substrate-binding protein [Chloroflexota bacterium]|nr:MAG: glycine/betaine ABC transporter substrate-binding protein [Chloroflexota bacterium]